MRIFWATIMLGIALLAWAASDAPIHAQSAVPQDERQLIAEFGRLSQRISQNQDPDQAIPDLRRAFELERAIRNWPSMLPARELIRADLHALLGQAFLMRRQGDRADNLERAIPSLEAAVAVPSRKEQMPYAWALSELSLAIALSERARGEKADNIERALQAYSAALSVLTAQAYPADRARALNYYSHALLNRERADRAESVEQSIAAVSEALTLVDRQGSPIEWAGLQRALANAYSVRIKGDRAENLETALIGHQASLSALTREAAPAEWAATQMSMATVYSDRVRGDRSDNIEKSITASQAAMTVFTREDAPLLWAAQQHNLSKNYVARIAGSRADNIEQAIAAAEAALTITTAERYPREWAETNHNLSQAYFWRIRGERGDNLQKTVSLLESALPVWQSNGMPVQWARSLNNLAIAYQYRYIETMHADDLEAAIKANELALTVRKREALPLEWAETQGNLANCYMMRSQGDRSDNLERAIAANEAALAVYTRDAHPREWASGSNNIASSYMARIKGDRAANLGLAARAYADALEVRRPEALPRDSLGTAKMLGETRMQLADWEGAAKAFEEGRRAFLVVFGQGLVEEEAREVLAQAGDLFANAAFVAAHLGRPDEALKLASEGRARMMAVALRLQGLGLDPAKRQRLDELRAAIRTQSRAYGSMVAAQRGAALATLMELRRELLGLVEGTAGRSMTAGPDSSLAAARNLVPLGGAIAAAIVTARGTKILLLTSGERGLSAIDLPELTTARVQGLVRGDGRSVGAEGGWLGAFKIQSLPEPERSARIGEWTDAIEGIGAQLWSLLAGRLDAALQAQGVKAGARIVWLPAGAIGLLPLGLAEAPGSGRRLGDAYEIVTVPSLDALAQSARRIATAAPVSLAATVNPTGEMPELDLPFTEVEGALITSRFDGWPQSRLGKADATPRAVLAALKGRSYWHFASHGFFDWKDARSAGLRMRGDKPLTIGMLLDAEGLLGRPRLVVLSACETGLYDSTLNPEEFVGLPATFLQLGAAGVLATLWQVDDLATALLMARFYELHLGMGLAPPTALKHAQSWLRSSTQEELVAYAGSAGAAARLDTARLAELQGTLASLQRGSTRHAAVWNRLRTRGEAGTGAPDGAAKADHAGSGHRPFAHPYFWGGFVYTGL